MSVTEVVGIRSDSQDSFEDAIRKGIEEAKAVKSTDRIRGAWVARRKLEVENGVVTGYCVHMLVSVVAPRAVPDAQRDVTVRQTLSACG